MMNSNVKTFESVFIKIPQLKSKDVIIGSIYRPPDTSIPDFLEDLDKILQYLSNSKKKVILMGDFNIDILRHNEHQSTAMFLNMRTSHRYAPTILRPTRITEFTATLIDNIFINFPNKHMDSCLIIDDLSDHLPIVDLLYMDLHFTQVKIENNSTKRIFSDSAKEAFMNSLLNTDWTFVEDQISMQNINVVYTSLITKYKSLYDLAFPLVKVTQKRQDGPRQPWMTMALLKSCKKKAKLGYIRNFLKNPTPQNKLKFTQYRNKFKQIKKLSESNYYAESFTQCKNDLNKTWKIIKKILHSN